MSLMKIGLITDVVLVLIVLFALGILFQKNNNMKVQIQENIQRIEKIEKVVEK